MGVGSGLIIIVVLTTAVFTWGVAWLYFSGRFNDKPVFGKVLKMQKVEEPDVTLAIMNAIYVAFMEFLNVQLGIKDDGRFRFNDVAIHQYKDGKMQYTIFELWKGSSPFSARCVTIKIDYKDVLNPVISFQARESGLKEYGYSEINLMVQDCRSLIQSWIASKNEAAE